MHNFKVQGAQNSSKAIRAAGRAFVAAGAAEECLLVRSLPPSPLASEHSATTPAAAKNVPAIVLS